MALGLSPCNSKKAPGLERVQGTLPPLSDRGGSGDTVPALSSAVDPLQAAWHAGWRPQGLAHTRRRASVDDIWFTSVHRAGRQRTSGRGRKMCRE